jgi:hypothetical protein
MTLRSGKALRHGNSPLRLFRNVLFYLSTTLVSFLRYDHHHTHHARSILGPPRIHSPPSFNDSTPHSPLSHTFTFDFSVDNTHTHALSLHPPFPRTMPTSFNLLYRRSPTHSRHWSTRISTSQHLAYPVSARHLHTHSHFTTVPQAHSIRSCCRDLALRHRKLVVTSVYYIVPLLFVYTQPPRNRFSKY